jgi:alpha-ketoglutaric semialdehyde dehydrogenase
MFLLPEAVKARGEAIAKGWAGSLTMGAGQFCTNPGIAVVDRRARGRRLRRRRNGCAQAGSGAQTMLTDGIAAAYRAGRDRVAGVVGRAGGADLGLRSAQRDAVSLSPPRERRMAGRTRTLGEEVFGPLGLIVRTTDCRRDGRSRAALHGQLTCTLHLDAGDTPLGQPA